MFQKSNNKNIPIYQLYVVLKDIEPLIWRRIQVSGNVSLYRLNLIVQKSMGWTNSHLNQFLINESTYGLKLGFDEYEDDIKDEKRFKLIKLITEENAKFDYIYDLGDDWEHEVIVEKIMTPAEGVQYPVCIDGRRTCPPEDCGGPSGYQEFIEAVCDPAHPEHQAMIDWLGYKFDPLAFDLESVNKKLRKMR
jgi:hypothetical protein